MYRLLPPTAIARLERDYHLRLAIIIALLLGVALAIGIAVLTPAFFTSMTNAKTQISQRAVLEEANARSGAGEYTIVSESSRTMLAELAPVMQSKSAYPYVEAILTHRTAGIALSSFLVSLENSASAMMTISGLASTRGELLAFADALKQDGRFIKVDLPVSDLAKSRSISFTITLNL